MAFFIQACVSTSEDAVVTQWAFKVNFLVPDPIVLVHLHMVH